MAKLLNPELWARVRRMSPAELLDRGRQEFAKRRDAILYRFGKRFDGESLLASPAAPARFFFEPGEVPELAALYRSRFPTEAEALLARAERVCRHQFDLLGYEAIDYGSEIDWHFDAVNRRRAPRKPWHQIRLLEFEEVGDIKVTWELNRHWHFVTLAIAECLRQDGRFAGELVRQWYAWRESNPYPLGVNWASSLEVAFRAMSWLWARALLANRPHLPGEFHVDLLRALALGARHIEAHLSTYSSPNTHLLGEAVGLFFIGTLCPELSTAPRWRKKGWRIVLEHAEHKVLPDGFYFEQSMYYHVYALDFFLHARMLAAANQMDVTAAFDRTIEKMLDVLCLLGRAGAPPRWGDDDGGRVFDPSRNLAEHLLDPLSTGAALFGRGDFKSVAGELRAETLWLLGRRGVERFDETPAQSPVAASVALQPSGMYMMSGSDEPRQQMVVDGGPLGGDTGGHGHADTLGLHLTIDGKECLTDPGTFLYVAANGERDAFRGSAAHNVLLVDGMSHAEFGGPFSWRSRPEARIEQWVAGESFDLFVASHDGYARLPQPVTHRRCVFYLRNRYWLVRDLALGSGTHELDILWHLAPDLRPVETSAGAVLSVVSPRVGLAFLAAEPHAWERRLEQGWCSPAYGKKVQAPVLRFRRRGQLPAELATMICPVKSPSEGLGSFSRIEGAAEDGVFGYEYSAAREADIVIFSEKGAVWKLGPWASDAKMLYCRRAPSGVLQRVTLVGGSFVERDGRKLLLAARRVARCEWRREAAGWRISCSDDAAVEFRPEGDAGESFRGLADSEKAI